MATGGAELRKSVQAEVLARAARRRGARSPRRPAQNGTGPVPGHRSLSASVRSLPPLAAPAASSPRPGATLLKRTVQRTVSWMVDPVYWQVNALREATIKALD